eukprot:TRINITY_DN1329_c1_g1_i2.p1 TRINITY_DN1329_c1_g1~~TRINITY_DN1329_c1_g1_i2.p1  ORF type:complete len:223 (-),score=80.45 TRINITY_DN1329_c1_g1_i2:229-897(-)
MISSNRNNKIIYFIRHAQSTWNEAMSTTGRDPMHFDALLTQKGITQAQNLRKKLEENNVLSEVELIVVSPLSRCLLTCEIGLEDYIKTIPVVILPTIREIISGSDDTGNYVEDLEKQFKHFSFDLLKLEPRIWWYTDGSKDEPLAQFRQRFEQNGGYFEPDECALKRVKETIDWLKNCSQTKICVVSHSDFINSIIGRSLKNAELCEFNLSADFNVETLVIN